MPETLISNHYAVPLDAAMVRAEWSREGYSFHRMTDPPGQRWDGFVHETDEYLTVAEGRLQVDVGPDRVIAEPGDLLFIPARVIHSVRNIHSGATTWFFGYA